MIYVEYNDIEGWKFYDKDRTPEESDNKRELISRKHLRGRTLMADDNFKGALGFMCKRQDILNISSYDESEYACFSWKYR